VQYKNGSPKNRKGLAERWISNYVKTWPVHVLMLIYVLLNSVFLPLLILSVVGGAFVTFLASLSSEEGEDGATPISLLVVGEDTHICLICKRSLRAGDEALECPLCRERFHREHLLEWLKTRSVCPNCGQELAADKLKDAEKDKKAKEKKNPWRDMRRMWVFWDDALNGDMFNY